MLWCWCVLKVKMSLSKTEVAKLDMDLFNQSLDYKEGPKVRLRGVPH